MKEESHEFSPKSSPIGKFFGIFSKRKVTETSNEQNVESYKGPSPFETQSLASTPSSISLRPDQEEKIVQIPQADLDKLTDILLALKKEVMRQSVELEEQARLIAKLKDQIENSAYTVQRSTQKLQNYMDESAYPS